MQIKKPAISLAVSFILLPYFASAQAVYSGSNKAPGDYNAKISKTAEALGISVYEDYPVRQDASYRSSCQVPMVSRPVPVNLKYSVPELSDERISVPSEFSGTEPASYVGLAVTIWNTLKSKVSDTGWLPGTEKPASFEEISDRVLKASRSAAFPARRAGQPSLFTDAGFISEFENATGARFSGGNYARFLIDGPEAFSVKDSLIKNAKKSLLISSWAFYDDTTGYEAAQMLIKKKQQGVSVQVMVDNSVSSSHGRKVLKLLEKAGVEVLRHNDADRSADIWHVKVMIADDKYAVAGGMNFGDVYSHKGSGSVKWRDTDVLFSGSAVLEAKKLIGAEWNANVSKKKLPFKSVDTRGPQNSDFEGGSARVSVVLANPPKTSPILVSIIKAMYGATRTINIENAYFVAIPVVSQAVIEALDRGVEVNLLTNSKESIDSEGKPIVDAMAKCLMPLVQAGAKVYLKQGEGQTLHSKFMTVDGEFASIGSYNLHPRGERSDSELNVNVLDRASVAQLDAAFAQDVSIAKRVNSAKELEEKPGWLSRLMSEYFYEQLSPRK
ncbi:MAG: hypothetical protein COT18_01055 [Elusimicrobia bacterium CG08_land_8_20_14_0_20_59_10]|nr:MAG: hypothetical protein COT18_01055 [Elusimicrobia bacterium CG08_land_8_20_14_0_20_59_10]